MNPIVSFAWLPWRANNLFADDRICGWAATTWTNKSYIIHYNASGVRAEATIFAIRK
jgi:hypothetical protein